MLAFIAHLHARRERIQGDDQLEDEYEDVME